MIIAHLASGVKRRTKKLTVNLQLKNNTYNWIIHHSASSYDRAVIELKRYHSYSSIRGYKKEKGLLLAKVAECV